MKNKFIGLTIGPLYKTLTSVKHTRELWGASYIFSYIMKKIIAELKSEKEFIIPYTGDNEVFEQGFEVGAFHDKFIFKDKDGSDTGYNDLERTIDKVLKHVAEKMLKTFSIQEYNEIENYLKRYFQIYYCEVEVEADKHEMYKKANEELNYYLDVMELQSKFLKKIEDKKNYLFDLFDKVNKSFLIEDAFCKKRHSFPCIAEIAACEIWDKGIKISDDDADIYKQLKEMYNDKFKQYHKYIAIVQADGDNLGNTIKSLKDNNDFGKLSKVLLKFSKQADEKIKEFGGRTVFAGGDDLLFFAPVVSRKKNVFELVNEIADIFYDNFIEFENKPTLSTGISITYYKYPMGEALENAASLLFDKAKNFEGKNAIAYKLQKHSGQNFSGVFNRNNKDYVHFKNLIFKIDDEKMLTSIIHKLNFHNAIINEIGSNEEKLKNYFDNFFNESEHKKHQNLIDSSRFFINEVFNDSNNRECKIELIDSTLRLKKFLGGER